MKRTLLTITVLACAAPVPALSLFHAHAGEITATGESVFRTDSVRPLTLAFTQKSWSDIAPAGAAGSGVPGGRGGMNPASGLSKKWFAEADKDKDGKVTADEWTRFVNAAVASWKDASGNVAADSITRTLDTGNAGRGPGGMIGANGKNGMAAAMGITFKYVHADLTFAGETVKDVGVRFSGNNTYMTSRDEVAKPYKVKTDEYDGGRSLAGIDKFNLRNNINDASAMNEVLSYALYEAAGVPSPRTGYALLNVDVDGTPKPAGVYTVVENVGKRFLKDRFGVKKNALGALFKPSTRDLFGYLGDDWSAYEKIYSPQTGLTAADKARVIAFAKLLKDASDEEFAARLPAYVDIDEVARYLAVTVELGAMDSILSMGQNFYLYLEPKTNRFLLLPWDLDHSFGQWMGGDLATLSIVKPWSGDNRFLERLFATPAFRDAYLKRLTIFNDTLFRPDAIAARVDALAAVLRPVIARETPGKLAAFDAAVSDKKTVSANRPPRENTAPAGTNDHNRGGRSDRGSRGGPGGPGMASTPIKVYAKTRHASVSDQLAGKTVATASDNRRGPGGPGGFGPGRFLGESLLKIAGKDGAGLVAKFSEWDADHDGALSAAELGTGLAAVFPRGGAPDGMRDGGPPADMPPPPFGDDPEDDR